MDYEIIKRDETIACLRRENYELEKQRDDLLTDLTAARNALLREGINIGELIETLVKYGKPPFDWACKQCVPHSDIIIEGFACQYHAAINRAKSATCETCNGRGEIGGHVGQTPESFDYISEPCPDCVKGGS